MKCAVVMFSELGNRWDAGFHLVRVEHKKLTEALKRQFPEPEAAETRGKRMAESMTTAELQVLRPLTRGSHGNPTREKLMAAIAEYPHLSLAILIRKGREALEAARTEALQALNRAEASLHELSTLEEMQLDGDVTEGDVASADEPASLADIDPIPDEVADMLKVNRYVYGVVYDDGDSFVIPVHTSETAWVADCWMIEKGDWKGTRTLDDLAAEGNVPVPRRYDELGTPIGYLSGLPDHEQNYGLGWR